MDNDLQLEDILKDAVPESSYSDPDVEKMLFTYMLKNTSLSEMATASDCHVSALYSHLGTFGPRQVCQYMFKRYILCHLLNSSLIMNN